MGLSPGGGHSDLITARHHILVVITITNTYYPGGEDLDINKRYRISRT